LIKNLHVKKLELSALIQNRCKNFLGKLYRNFVTSTSSSSFTKI